MKNKIILVKEMYRIDESQGAAALFAGVQKVGYKMVRMDRKGKSVTVTYQKE